MFEDALTSCDESDQSGERHRGERANDVCHVSKAIHPSSALVALGMSSYPRQSVVLKTHATDVHGKRRVFLLLKGNNEMKEQLLFYRLFRLLFQATTHSLLALRTADTSVRCSQNILDSLTRHYLHLSASTCHCLLLTTTFEASSQPRPRSV